jgi:tRNA-Thr(GGU) m(6)t(6)A37 methyltransferase TsaA
MYAVNDDQSIVVNPIGVVRSKMENVDDLTLPGRPAQVEIYASYQQGLLRIEENSHLWLLLWFHKANRRMLTSVPHRFNPNLPDYGVFGLRSPHRPNPIALCLVKLEATLGNILEVSGLDAIDGTPVLDIKPYYEHDIIFSPRTPYIRAVDRTMRQNIMLKEALMHHQEECPGSFLGVRMGLVADEFMGHLNSSDLSLTIDGFRCLGDTLQGLSRARLANPSRFNFQENLTFNRSIWERPGRSLVLTARQEFNVEDCLTLADEELFSIELK